jgi:hypothetical protein
MLYPLRRLFVNRKERRKAEENGKGCDLGYAPASDSCEGVVSEDACTVAAFDAATAFAVPTSADVSQRRRFFRVWRLPRVASLNRPLSLLQATPYLLPLFSTIDYGFYLGYALAAGSCERAVSVDARTVVTLDAITAFAVPDLGGHLAAPSIFSGLVVAASRLAQPTAQHTSSRPRICCRSFLPSTKAILTHEREMSTPKVCAHAIFSRSMRSSQQAIAGREVLAPVSEIFYIDSHLFHRIATFHQALFEESISYLDESRQMNELRGDQCVP